METAGQLDPWQPPIPDRGARRRSRRSFWLPPLHIKRTRSCRASRKTSAKTTCVNVDDANLSQKEIFELGQHFWSLTWKIKLAKLITGIELQMAPINITSKRTHAQMSLTPATPRFKDFDDIEYVDTITFSKWSISVRVEVKFLPNSYGDNICFILMDKNGAKIETSVWGHTEVDRFNHILQTGCKYLIHGVKINPNAEDVEFRAIGHIYELSFDRNTIVEPCLPIVFPMFPKHLMPFTEVAWRPNKTFVDIVGIVVHCCEHEPFKRLTKYKEAIIMDAWGHFHPVGIWGCKLIQNSYRWSTAENGKPIVIATMLQKDNGFDGLNTSEHTNFTFNPDHPTARPLQDIRQELISGAIDIRFMRKFLERRWAFLETVWDKKDARCMK